MEQDETASNELSAEEISEGKALAIISYIGPLCLIPIILRNNEFSLYHARQGLLLGLGMFALNFLLTSLIVFIFLVPFCRFIHPRHGYIRNRERGQRRNETFAAHW